MKNDKLMHLGRKCSSLHWEKGLNHKVGDRNLESSKAWRAWGGGRHPRDTSARGEHITATGKAALGGTAGTGTASRQRQIFVSESAKAITQNGKPQFNRKSSSI